MPPDRRPQDQWRRAAAGPARTPVPGGRPGSTGGGRKWFAAAVVLLALVGVIAGLIVYLRPDPEPVLLAVAVTEYTHRDWPPNPWAEADAAGLTGRFGADTAPTFQSQERGRVLGELNRLADDSRGKNRRRPVVAYVCGLGTVHDGTVYLVPGDGRPDSPTTWLSLDDLLDPLRKTDAPRLLILDLRPVRAVRAGLAGEDVNDRLADSLQRLEQAGDLPFAVLSAHNPPDGPNTSVALRRSLFGAALAHAAGGAADGWNPGRSQDHQVSAGELAAYAREATHHLSQSLGLPPQLPRVFGPAADFPLLPVPANGPTPLPEPPAAEEYPAWLLDAWKVRDGWLAEGVHRSMPRAFLHLQAVAGRAEARWLAGADPKAVQDELRGAAEDLKRVKAAFPPLSPPKPSVARVRAAAGGTVPKLAEVKAALDPVFDRIRDGTAKPEEVAAAQQAAWGKAADAAPFDAAAVAAFGFAVTLEDPSVGQLKQLSATLRGFRPGSGHAEIAFLHFLADLPPEATRRWPAGTVRRLVLLAQAAEAAAVLDGRSWPWVREQLAEADALRRKAVAALADPETPDADIERAAGELDGARRALTVVRDTTAAVEKAVAEAGEACAVLAEFAIRFPDDLLPGGGAAESGLAGLADKTRRLLELLTPPEGGRPAEPEKFNDAVNRLATDVGVARSRLVGLVAVPTSAGPRLTERALDWPLWPADRRAGLYRAAVGLGEPDARKVGSLLPTSPAGQEPRTPPPAEARVRDAARRAADRLTDLLRVARAPDLAELTKRAEEAGTNATAVGGYARWARRVWCERLPDEFRKATDLGAKAARGWAVHPFDVPAVPPPGEPPAAANPEPLFRREQERAFHAGLAEARYRADAAAFRKLRDVKAAGEYAARLADIAQEHADWSP